MNKVLQEKLAEAQEAYDSIESISGERPAEADYVGKLEAAQVRLSSEQKPMIIRGHRVTEGENEGTYVSDFMSLMNGFGKGRAEAWVEKMGYEFPKKLVDLPDTLDAIIAEEPEVEFTVKHAANSDTLINVDVTNVLGEDNSSTSTEEAPAEKVPPEDNVDEDTRKEMLVFCGAWDLDCNKDDDYDTLFKIIKDNEYDEEKLDEDESALLTALELEECIIKPAPKVQKKAASKASKVVKKTAGKVTKVTRKR